ncbi:type II toxin-antitoxin system Phd/YefM family antitoxin [Streptomyces sp. NPDC101150]|uniref:type II toxin-antitoxin system Phd/YefM family antitoxin n=1 Tax=Streptomyces sp. NPDC101150 TaxID=3366114 RepID=UPI003820DF5C
MSDTQLQQNVNLAEGSAFDGMEFEAVNVQELNRQAARVLERVKAGETLVVTEYRRPIAALWPWAEGSGEPEPPDI